MSAQLTLGEETQLSQTVEMFEVITESQPLDCQSLEILKEAYFKLGRSKEAVATAKRVAEAHLQLGQISSAILEYEGILQLFPEDLEVQKALAEIEGQAANLSMPGQSDIEDRKASSRFDAQHAGNRAAPAEVLDGKETMKKLFTESRRISDSDFEQCWPSPVFGGGIKHPIEPFIQVIAERQIVPIEVSMKLLLDKARLGYLPIEKYDLDVELARSIPRDICLRWCILAFDRLSKSTLVATANPFNKQAANEIEQCVPGRVLWYISVPGEIVKMLRKIFR
jgi:tetratricopeptide (TPR) repeat protein